MQTIYVAHILGSVDSVDRIRVLLANHPTIIPDLVRTLIEAQPDMEIVGDSRGPMRILQEVGRTKADAVILVQVGSGEPGLCSQLLAVYPDLTILGIAPDMKTAFVEQIRSRRRDIVNTQNANIVETLRASVREPWS